MTAALVTACPVPILQFFGNNGQPNAGGTVLTQVGGINFVTYQDQGVTPLPNPIPLNSRGEVSNATGASCQLFLVQGVVYQFTLFDANGNQLDVATYVAGTTTPSQSSIGQILYPQTTAEIAASVIPTAYWYPEGDIRRYGAVTVQPDNSGAINQALLVSSNGGAAAYIPGGTWGTGFPCVAPPGSSMYGAGTASVLLIANSIDGIQFTTSDAGIIARSRYFSNFQIIGTLSGTTNTAHGIYINASVISHVKFDNVSVLNFQWGAYVNGLYYSVFFQCFFQNCWHGVYFVSQSIDVSLLDCYEQLTSASTVITGAGSDLVSSGIEVSGAPEVEGLHIQGGGLYGYQYDIKLALVFECQIEAVDIANATVCPVYLVSNIGGVEIRDCTVELGPTAAGTWNNKVSVGDGNLTGIFIAAVTAANYAEVHIHDNNIVCDQQFLTGSTGIYIGNGNNGAVVHGNNILAYDNAISGGNSTVNTGSFTVGSSIKNNQITCNTSSININSFSSELDLGPNYVTAGPQAPAFNSGAPASMTYKQPNAPMSGTAIFATSTAVGVTFTNALPLATYKITLSQNATSTSPPWYTSKATTGFNVNMASSFTGTVDWTVSFD